MAVTDLGMGLVTFVIDSQTYLGEGSAGCEGDIAFGKGIGYTAPFDAKLINKQYYIKGTLNEVNATLIADIWGDTAATLGRSATTYVNPPTVAVSAAFPQGTFALTAAVACDFGEISAGESDTTSVTFTFKGIADGTSAQGSWT